MRAMAAISPKSLFDILDDAITALDEYRRDPHVTKADVLDSMDTRLSIALRKMLATPTCTGYSMFRPKRVLDLPAEAGTDNT